MAPLQQTAIRTVFFDLDGTLIDTEPTAARVLQTVLQGWGIQAGHEDARAVVGRTWSAAFDYLFSRYPLPVPRAEAETKILRLYHDMIERHLPEIPGAVSAVRSLADAGIVLALVSGSHRATIEWALTKLGIRDCFGTLLGAEDYPRGKPAPDPYLTAAQITGAAPHSAVVFEDSSAGIDSALAAGCRVVAVTAANHFGQDLSRAHHQITDFRAVNPAWLAALRVQ